MSEMSMRVIATAVAKEMGDGWAIETKKRDYPHYAEIQGPNDMTIGFNSSRGKGKLYISGKLNDRDAAGRQFWSVPHGRKYPAMGVSRLKSPKQIAAEIRRRLMPEYTELHALLRKAWEETGAHRSTTAANAQQIAEALGVRVSLSRGLRSQNPDSIEISLYDAPKLGDGGHGSLTVSADHVTFRDFRVSAEESMAIFELLATMRAESQAHATIAASGRGCPKSGGWAIFNECEIQRDDEAKLFAHDDDAKEHIAACEICRAMLTIEAGNLGLDVANLLKPEAQGDGAEADDDDDDFNS
jgi:hypothetical protein